MRTPMDERTYLNFYTNTVLGSSRAVYNHICKRLLDEHRITFDDQTTLDDADGILYFDLKTDRKTIIVETTSNRKFSGFYEKWEFEKLYKYSVPFFYQCSDGVTIKDLLEKAQIKAFVEPFEPEFVLNTVLKESEPIYWESDGCIFVKFVIQKSYIMPDSFERTDYRYPVVIFFDTQNSILETRYDAIKYGSEYSISTLYEQIVVDCISWLKKFPNFKLFICDHMDFIQVVNSKSNDEVKIYKQMMQLSTGGSAELTAAEGADYILPFIGELKELIEENDKLFSQAEDIRNLLQKYLADKEETASYPYIYVKWVKPVESQSYIIKVTFDYLNHRYTLMQHIAGDCKDLGMERMNSAIKYLCKTGSFVKGEEV